MFVCNTTFIKTHSGRTSYYNHSFDRLVREAYCSECMGFIGHQTMYDGQEEYHFDDNHVDKYIYCPYCSHKFDKKRVYQP